MANKTSPHPANRVRIIGGEYRRRILRFPTALQLRPTPDRVRETVFNWLGQDLSGLSCLDLFAGSGALGFEAASRGASQVLMLERDRQVVSALRENQRLLKTNRVQIVQGDALEFLRDGHSAPGGPYDVVFLDPPYTFGETQWVIAQLGPRTSSEAMMYREGPDFIPDPMGWCTYRKDRAGAVHYQLLKANRG